MPDLFITDSGFKTIWTLTQAGVAYPLTDATIAITFTKPDGTTLSKTGAIEGLATLGQVAYTWAVGDIDQAGTWKVAFAVTKGTEIVHGIDTFVVGAI